VRSSSATAQIEDRDARRLLDARGQSGSVQVVWRYVAGDDTRLAVVRTREGLFALSGARTARGWRIDMRHLHARHGRAEVVLVDEGVNLFAVTYDLTPTPATGGCTCTSPGGERETVWLRVARDGRIHPTRLRFDPSLGGARWLGGGRAEVVQTLGPVRCPAGCPPAPSYAIVQTTTYELREGLFVQIEEERERRH